MYLHCFIVTRYNSDIQFVYVCECMYLCMPGVFLISDMSLFLPPVV